MLRTGFETPAERDTLIEELMRMYDIRIANSKFGRGGVRSDGDYWTDGKAKTSYAQLTMLEASFHPKENGILLEDTIRSSSSSRCDFSRFEIS